MATTQDELDDIRSENDKKRKQIEEEHRKAALLQSMVENDTTKAALMKESENLDVELARAKSAVAGLEEVSGVSSESLKVPVMRATVPIDLTAASVAPEAEGETPSPVKRTQK